MNESGDEVVLTHLGPRGDARMVDVSDKNETHRLAVASAVVNMRPEVLDAVLGGIVAKGEVLGTARVAGISAAKRTGELIPMCHPLGIDWARISFARVSSTELLIVGSVKTIARTGVEMEAMTAVSVAALTVYDMAKAADKGITIGPIRLEFKTGGKSGVWRRQA
jgi:cyclic pyranopterin phosphate synthase